MDAETFISERLAKAKSLINSIHNAKDVHEKARHFILLADQWNDGYPVYRHPLLEEVLAIAEDDCLSSILYDRLILINNTENVCSKCKTSHTGTKISLDDIAWARALQTSFISESWEDECWQHLFRQVSSSPCPLERVYTSVPVQLYANVYERVFDPTTLRTWESFLLVLRAPKVKLEFFRYIMGQSLCTESGPVQNIRHRSLFLKTLRAIISDPLISHQYKHMLKGPLAPELKALCIDCFSLGNNEEAKFIYSYIS
jgi:hypothetical protein